MISVIVPVYNVEQYLNRCIESIANQTYNDLEIILVNDGSTDSSGAICDEWAIRDQRIQVIHRENGGLSCARNLGIEASHGEFITFVDSDDYISPKTYEKSITLLTQFEADICQYGVSQENETGRIFGRDIFPNGKLYSTSEIIKNVILPLKTAAWNKVFRKELIKKSRFPVGKIHGEDLLFFLSIYDKNIKLVSSDYIGYHYIKRKGSITTQRKSTIHDLDEIYCKDKAFELLQKISPQDAEVFKKWCFQARLTLLRRIIFLQDSKNRTLSHSTIQWLRKNFCTSIKVISIKQAIEALLIIITPCIYKRIIQLI